jgi:starch phosphorylase
MTPRKKVVRDTRLPNAAAPQAPSGSSTQPGRERRAIAEIPDMRTGLRLSELRQGFLDNLIFNRCRLPGRAGMHDIYMGIAYTIRDRLLHRWIGSAEEYFQKNRRMVCYLSAEYLPGPHLGNNLINLGIYELVRAAVAKAGFDLHDILDEEPEPGLGNGGLGRLAACFMDSLATLEIPAIGYGIRY